MYPATKPLDNRLIELKVMAKATISRVVGNNTNGPQVILTLSTGEVQFFPISYIQKVLDGAFMSDARPTALVGTEVEYTKMAYAIGDKVVDAKGATVVPNILHKKAGTKLINFTFGEIAGTVNDYDRAKMVANATANAIASIKASFTKPKLVLEEESEASLVLDSSDAI